MNKSTPTKRIPFAPPLEYDTVWHGAMVSKSGEKGQLLPDTHNVGSTWHACVDKLQRKINSVNKRDVDA